MEEKKLLMQMFIDETFCSGNLIYSEIASEMKTEKGKIKTGQRET